VCIYVCLVHSAINESNELNLQSLHNRQINQWLLLILYILQIAMRLSSTLLLAAVAITVSAARQPVKITPSRDKEECITGDDSNNCSAKASNASDSKAAIPNSNDTTNANNGAKAKAHDTKGYTTRSSRNEPSNQAPDKDEDSLPPPNTCVLYLAPSTIPHAILGLFSGTSIPTDENANTYLSGTYPGFTYDEEESPLWSDLYIPVADVFKTLPYRGQQRFPSWLGYVWPSERGAFHHEGEMAPFPNFGDEVKGYDDGLNREWVVLIVMF
jgi:hypothetical protein